MIDVHLHVWRHEPGTPPVRRDQLERYCEAAAAGGIEQIAITEHAYRFTRMADEVLRHWDRPSSGPLADATDRILGLEAGGDLDQYVGALVDAQRSGLPILVGLEVDHFPGAMDATATLLAEYPLDVVLGSVHWLGDWLFDDDGTAAFAREWEVRDVDDVYRIYVDAIEELTATGVADVLAHVDVVKVAGHRPPTIAAHERRLADVIAAADVAVELSSAGLHKPAAEVYPSPQLLDLLVERGVPLTTASDAHEADLIGRSFDVLAAELDARGVDELVTFERRQRRAVRRGGTR